MNRILIQEVNQKLIFSEKGLTVAEHGATDHENRTWVAGNCVRGAGFCVRVADVGMFVVDNRTLVAGFCVWVAGNDVLVGDVAALVGENVLVVAGFAVTVADYCMTEDENRTTEDGNAMTVCRYDSARFGNKKSPNETSPGDWSLQQP
jgi:hypothetical protein